MDMTKTRIKQKYDTLANWLSNDIVLLAGELAVVDCGSSIRFKIGNGTSNFSGLQFIDQNLISTEVVDASSVSASSIDTKAISQGTHANSIPLGFAAGAYLSAGAHYSQVLGYDAQSKASDQYAFVWNGDDARALYDYYESHGKGSFSINPANGISGFWIGEQSLAQILSAVNADIDARLLSSDISAEYRNQHIYLSAKGQVVGDINCVDFFKDGMLSSVELCSNKLIFKFNTDASKAPISIDLSSFVDNYDERIAFLSSAISANTEAFANYYTKSETSSASEVSAAFNALCGTYAQLSDISKVYVKDPGVSAYQDGKQSDLSVVKVTNQEYASLLQNGTAEPNALYVVSSEYIDAYGTQMKNLAAGTDISDAVTVGQLNAASSAISSQVTANTTAINTLRTTKQDIIYGTTEQWYLSSTYVPAAGQIVVWTDKDVMLSTVLSNDVEVELSTYVPGIKIGDGGAYNIDLPFLGDDVEKKMIQMISDHANESEAHVSEEDRAKWNHKISLGDISDPNDDGVVGETLVITRN